jgi:CBS domain-containing protein
MFSQLAEEHTMPSVRDVLNAKGDELHSIPPGATVLDAIRKMNHYKIGALVVMEGSSVVGMFTERDILRRVAGEERPVAQVLVGEVMTTKVICCMPDADLDEVSTLMKNHRVRHVPVCDEAGRLHGLISIGDVNAVHASHQEQTINFLNDYIYGRA